MANVNNYRLGLVSVSFRKNTPEEILEAMRDAKLSCVEWGSDVHAPCNDKENIARIVELQRAYGIKCSSYGTYFKLGATPIGELADYIEAAKLLGTDVLRLWCGVKSGAEYSTEEKNALFADARTATEMAEREGVILCMECHRNSFTERVEDTLELMREINSPSFRMYWQPFQWRSVEEDIEYAKKIEAYTENIHVFNWEGDGRFPLIEAKEEWQSYLGCFSHPRTLLLEFMPDGKIETLKREADALRKIAGGM